ncbi:MAG: hypothetical protein ROO71_13035 [Balneola sp.]
MKSHITFIVSLCLIVSCSNADKISKPIEGDNKELKRGDIYIYPSRMSEINSGGQLLDLGNLLEPDIIYNALVGTRQSSYSDISSRKAGFSAGVSGFSPTSMTEGVTSNESSESTNSSENNASSTSGSSGDSSSVSSTQNQATTKKSDDSSSTTITSEFIGALKDVLQSSELKSPENTSRREIAYRELITAVANAQLGGKGLQRRLNLSPLVSEKHKLFTLPVDVHFIPGRITSQNHIGNAELTLQMPNTQEYEIDIIAVAPMGYSQVVTEYSSVLRELYLNSFAGINVSNVLAQGKLEGIAQKLLEFETVVSQPEFAANIISDSTVAFNYFGAKKLSGASVLKPQSFQVELILLIKGYNEDYLEEESISGYELLKKFENTSFNAELAEFVKPSKSPGYKYDWKFLPTKKIQKKSTSFSEESFDKIKKEYGDEVEGGKILVSIIKENFKSIQINEVSIYQQNTRIENKNSKNQKEIHYGFLIFKGQGLNTNEKIGNIYNNLTLVNSTYKEYGKKNEFYKVTEPSVFTLSISNENGEVIANNKVPSRDWIGDNFISIGFESQKKLYPGEKLSVILKVRELINDKVLLTKKKNSITDNDSESVSRKQLIKKELDKIIEDKTTSSEVAQERIILFKTLTIKGKKPKELKKGITNLKVKSFILERELVGFEITYNSRDVSVGNIKINDKIVTDLYKTSSDKKDEVGNPYKEVTQVVKLKLNSGKQGLDEIKKNNYYLVFLDKNDPQKVLAKLLIE